MVKIRILLLLLLGFICIFANFNILTETNSYIDIEYIPDSLFESKYIVLPPDANYNINLISGDFSVNDISKRAIYFGDLYLLPLLAKDKEYTVRISYTETSLSGRIIGLSKDNKNYFDKIIVNNNDIINRIKPRKAIVKKSLYPGTPVVNIKTDSTGIYRVYYDEIEPYSEIDLSTINPNNIQLFYKGQEIPMYINNIDDGSFNSGDYFEFYAERVKGDSTYFERYNTQNVYVLVVNGNNGARYIEYTSTISDDSLVNEEICIESKILHIEKDSLFRRFTDSLPYDTCDFWYYQAISELDTLLFDENTIHINLLNKDTSLNYINIRAALFGYTKTPYSPDHPVEVYVNNNVIDTIEWDGIKYYEYERDSFYWDSSSININFKPLFLSGYSDTDTVSNNSILVNWVEIDYKKDFILNNGRLCFHLDSDKVNGRYRFIIKNLSNANIELYRKNLKKIINVQIEYDSLTSTYTAIFEDDIYSDNREYFIFEDNSMFVPQFDTFRFNDLSNINNKGEYIIIVPDDFKSYAEDLGDLFTDEHNVFVATTNEIYNEFSYGLISANAIKDFLVTAYNNWTIPPTHVLLLGDGSKDMNNHLGYFDYQIPIVFAYGIAFFSYVCSDNYYACVSGDDVVEDISVSRYPVRNSNDILNLKNKIFHYLDNKYYGIQNLRTIIAFDTADLPSVSSQIQDLKNVLPEYIYADTILNIEDYDMDLVNEFNQGSFFASFVAHGATQSIGAGIFLRIYDIYRMTNLDRLPFVATFSCNTVEFDQLYPDSFTISEAFVIHPFGGSIAFYGATGPSYNNSNDELSLFVFKEFSNYNEKNIGNIVKFAELEYYIKDSEQQIQNYNLLGVNFVDLNMPEKTSDEVEYVSSPITAGDTIKVVVRNNVINNGIMESILLQKNKYPISHASGEFVNGYGENYILTPDTLSIDNYVLLTMLRDEDTSIVYVSYPSVGSVSLIDFSISPENPDTNENYRIKAKFSDSNVLQNVYAFVARGDSNSVIQYEMIEDSLNSGVFYTQEFPPLLPYNTDSYLYYKLQFIDTNNYVYNTIQKKYLIPEKIDFCFSDNKIYLKSLDNKPYIYLSVVDLSLRTSTVENYFYIFDSVEDSLIGIDTIQPFINKTNSGVFLQKDIFNKKLLIYLDIENKIDEKNEENNMNVIVFPYKILFIPDTIEYETFYNFNIDILPINQDTSFISLYRQEVNINDSIGLIPYRDSSDIVYEYDFCNYDSNNVEISMFLDSLDDLYNYKLFLYNEKYQQFELISDSIEQAFSYSLLPGNNRFLIADYNDSVAPNVDLNIENKEYIDGIILTKNVKIGCTVEDNSGIKIEDLIVLINSDTLNDSCYTILKTTNTKSIPININIQLENGPYDITVIAKDIYNNQSSQTLSFQVTEQFKITHFANYPNPVTGNTTVFAAYLTEDAQNIRIKIYNSSGILVDEVNIGASQAGIVTFNYNVSSLPNGTYFYYFEAENNDEYDKSKISKMSILR